MSFKKLIESYTKKDFKVQIKRSTKLAQWAYLKTEGGFFTHSDGVLIYFVDGDVKLAHINDFVKRVIKYYDNDDLDHRDQALLAHIGELNSKEFRKLARTSMNEDAYKIIKIKKIKSDVKKKSQKSSGTIKVKRKRLAKAQKNLILRSQHHKCAMCQIDISKLPVHYDHRIPLAIDGSDEIENIQALCPNCHAIKTQRDRLAISRAKKRK